MKNHLPLANAAAFMEQANNVNQCAKSCVDNFSLLRLEQKIVMRA